MLALGIAVVALAVLFSLTALALWSTRQLDHPLVVSTGLATVLALGVVLLVV
jgi:hypothetical protein